MTNLTANERKAIEGIMNSEFHDGTAVVGNAVWSYSCNTFENKRSFSGTVSSLVKKGFVLKDGVGEKATLILTQKGYDAFYSLNDVDDAA